MGYNYDIINRIASLKVIYLISTLGVPASSFRIKTQLINQILAL